MRFAALALAAVALAPPSSASSLFGLGGSGLSLDLSTAETQQNGLPKPGTALYTNAVTYCAEAKAVLVDQFDIAYWRHNNSVTFSFSFASIEPNLNVAASLYLNDYGNTLFNETIELCTLLAGVLCPLPQVNFTGYGTYPLGDDIKNKIPSIAWTVPNLEAYARVQLVDGSTNEVAACLQATLSNGWSTKYPGVQYASGFFTLAAGLVGLAHSALVTSPSPAIYRWFDVLYLYQTAASAGLMHLNYPLVFSSFTQNFRWALALFHSERMQNTINTMREKTGGKLSSTAYDQVQYINRKLSPYNELVKVDMTDAVSSPSSFVSFMKNLPSTVGLTKRANIPSALDQQGASDLTTGVPVYTNSANIPQANAYDTIFFFFLAFVAIVLAFNLLVGALVLLLSRGSRYGRVSDWARRLKHTYWDFFAANLLRACLVFFLPIFIFGFYQWTIGRKDSGLSLFFSILGMLLVFAPLLTVLILSVVRARRLRIKDDVSPLYASTHFYHSVGDALYRQYRQKYHFFWFAPMVLGMIARAGFIGFGQSNPWAQVVGCLVVEFIIFCLQIGLRPHKDRKSDWLAPILTLFRMAMSGLLVGFIQDVGLKPIPRTVIGIVMIACTGIPTVLLFFGLIFNLGKFRYRYLLTPGYGYLWRRDRGRDRRRVEDGAELDDESSKDSDDQTPGKGLGHPKMTASLLHPHQHSESTIDAEAASQSSAAYDAYNNAANGRGNMTTVR